MLEGGCLPHPPEHTIDDDTAQLFTQLDGNISFVYDSTLISTDSDCSFNDPNLSSASLSLSHLTSVVKVMSASCQMNTGMNISFLLWLASDQPECSYKDHLQAGEL